MGSLGTLPLKAAIPITRDLIESLPEFVALGLPCNYGVVGSNFHSVLNVASEIQDVRQQHKYAGH